MKDGARRWKHLHVLERDVLLVLNAICKVGLVLWGLCCWSAAGRHNALTTQRNDMSRLLLEPH